jgi:hypothetical protein
MRLDVQVFFVTLVSGLAWAADDPIKTYSVVLDRPDTEYTVEVHGTKDPENLEITVENLGDTSLVNPRMTVNGLYDWYDVKSIVSEVTRDCRTDEEKALALWSWVLYKRFQRSPHDESALHPVRAMNGYGYGVCGENSAWLKCLWKAAGLQARVQELWGHTVSEVFYDGAWHMLDGNTIAFYLDRSNRSIASLATLEHDKGLIQRSLHSHDPWVRRPDPPDLSQEMANYIISYKDNYEEHSYDSEIAKDYTMAMTLKPGEKLVRWWKPELGKFEGSEQRAEAPERYANGQLTWEPDLRRIDIRPYLQSPGHGNIATRGQDGREPAIHVADLQDSLYTRPSVFTIPIASPYPIVGGRFACTLVKEDSSGLASISFGQPGWGGGDLYTFQWGQGRKTVELSLDSRIRKREAVYSYAIGFLLRGNGESKPASQAGVDSFRSVTDLQVSPHSLPALVLGKNTVRFWHQSPGPVKVRITHRWRPRDGPKPGVVASPARPADGGETADLAPTLAWLPVADPDANDKIADYQVMVSLRPDCRWPLSQALHQNVGSAKSEWRVPASFLNPGTTYYWKVRARDNQGNIGDWGPVFHFSTARDAH